MARPAPPRPPELRCAHVNVCVEWYPPKHDVGHVICTDCGANRGTAGLSHPRSGKPHRNALGVVVSDQGASPGKGDEK